MKKTILLIQITLFLLIFTDVYSQWQPKIKLTNHGFLHNGRCIAASGNIVHVVWHSSLHGNPEIYYKRSQDGGLNWGADIRLTNNSAESNEPSIAVSGSVVHVIWNDTRNGNYEVYYKRSQDGGLSWGPDTRLSDYPSKSHTSSISVSGSAVHVVWQDERYLRHEIYYKRSQNGGASWGTDTRLTNNIGDSWQPSVSASGVFVNVAWVDGRNGQSEIYYKRSQDGGTSWGTDTRLTNNAAANKYNPYISVAGAFVHVVWRDTRDGNNEIYYKRSQNGGTSWGTDTRLTNNTANSISPCLSVSGAFVHVVWEDSRASWGTLEIYYKRSLNGGTSWETDTPLTNDSTHKHHPSISVSGTVVHVFWRDTGGPTYELYYRNNPSGNPTNSTLIGTEIPKEYKLYQNYPNPFNPNTNIKFDITKSSHVKIIVYNTLGKEVAALVNEKLSSGSYEMSWNGSSYPSGVYFYTLISDDFINVKKMVLVK